MNTNCHSGRARSKLDVASGCNTSSSARWVPGPGSRIGAESPPFVNGSVTPSATVLRAGETYRLRFVDISSSDTYALWLESDERRDLSDSPVRLQVCRALEENGLTLPGFLRLVWEAGADDRRIVETVKAARVAQTESRR